MAPPIGEPLPPSTVIVKIDGPIATITLNRPEKLNAIFAQDYDAFSEALYAIDKRDDVLVTVWQGIGRWFCAGTNVDGSSSQAGQEAQNLLSAASVRRDQVARLTRVTDCSRALYTHTKILVAVLNGPALGIAAAYLGQFDFIYASPAAWLAVPFASLGIVVEVGSSITFAQRMGLAKAKEVLLWGKKITADELLQCGFVNKIFPAADPSLSAIDASLALHSTVRSYLLDLVSHLDPAALLASKALIKQGSNGGNDPDAVNLRESSEQVARFVTGVPGQRFGEIARKERRHKL